MIVCIIEHVQWRRALDDRLARGCAKVWPWLEQLVGQPLVEPEVTSSPEDPDPRGQRLRGWNFYGGKELRGAYCALPQARISGAVALIAASSHHRSSTLCRDPCTIS
jgi:hypothetical protein